MKENNWNIIIYNIHLFYADTHFLPQMQAMLTNAQHTTVFTDTHSLSKMFTQDVSEKGKSVPFSF